ncbi:MAG TPA: hypothetical protein DDZ41_06345 [Flavobacterium sp.]|nr:hypothetical protein [Flavobacterium sp.]
MKNLVFKILYLILISTFSIIWICDNKLYVFLEEEKISLYETAEKSETQNESEIKLKTLFFSQVDFLDLISFYSSVIQNNSLYTFIVKEFCFENHTPPPEFA